MTPADYTPVPWDRVPAGVASNYTARAGLLGVPDSDAPAFLDATMPDGVLRASDWVRVHRFPHDGSTLWECRAEVVDPSALPAALPPPVPLRAGGDARSASVSLSGPPTAPPSVLHGAADGGAADWRRDLAGVAIVVTSAAFLVGFDRLLWGA